MERRARKKELFKYLRYVVPYCQYIGPSTQPPFKGSVNKRRKNRKKRKEKKGGKREKENKIKKNKYIPSGP
jgi:hypothetical protein